MEHAKNLKQKVCFFESHNSFGSVENYLAMLINAFCEKSLLYEVTFFCPIGKYPDLLCKKINSKVRIIKYDSKEKGWINLIYFVKLLKKNKPSIIHINDPNPVVMMAANLCGIKHRIVTYHTPTYNINYNWRGKLSWKLAFTKDWNIIATSESLRDFMIIKRKLLSDRINVIHYGLDKERFKKKISPGEMKKKLNIPQDAFVIGNVARLCSQKAQDVLIKSIALLPDEILKNIIVLIAGAGKSKKSLQDLISTLILEEKVRLLGHRDDIPDILTCTDIFALSSIFEGACFAIMEAMAIGVPVIATDIEGVKDTVSNGETAVLVPPDNPQKLAEAIEMLYKDEVKRKSMGIKGKERFNQNFIREKMFDDTHSLYKNLLKQ